MSIPTEIAHLMLEAWDRVLPRLLKDPDELAARLARRRSAALTRPWRPYCLALKANDLRISPYRFIITPEHAVEKDDPRHPYEYLEHTVTLNPEAVSRLCTPYVLTPPGEDAAKVARKIGCSGPFMSHAIKCRAFDEVNYKPLLGGKRGHPVPVVLRHEPLDPGGERLWRMADPVFWSHHHYLAERVDEITGQTLTRTPFHGPIPRKRPCDPSEATGFSGWKWVCPACNQTARVIYQPLPPPRLNLQADLDKALGQHLDADHWDRGLPCWACRPCHKIRTASRRQKTFWNDVVTLFSAGLLYGREVERPAWLTTGSAAPRRHAAHTRTLAPRSPRRAEVLRLLTETDLPEKQIARETLLAPTALNHHIRCIYRDHGVKSRDELRAKLAEANRNTRVA